MSSYDIVKRIKVLVATERKSFRKAIALSQLQRKYEEYLALTVQLADKIYRQKKLQTQQPLTQFEKRNDEMNGKLRNVQDLVEAQKKLCEKLAEKEQQQMFIRDNKHALMDTLQALEAISGMYIKFENLPDRIQGVTVRRNGDSEKWSHFDINPLEHRLEQVQDLIWEKIERRDETEDHWRKLFFDKTNNNVNNEVICID